MQVWLTKNVTDLRPLVLHLQDLLQLGADRNVYHVIQESLDNSAHQVPQPAHVEEITKLAQNVQDIRAIIRILTQPESVTAVT